jgi:CRISPR-associated protein Cmr5
MNKARIDKMIPSAYEALDRCKIAKNGAIPKTFRGMISSFGASITMGSLLSAVCFFSDQGGASVDRSKLSEVIFYIIKKEHKEGVGSASNLYEYVKANNNRSVREEVCDATIAVKLAMNLYVLE